MTQEWFCPRHPGTLLQSDADGLRCPSGHTFPVIRSIPRFVEGGTYADHFGAQWNQYRRTQLDSYTGLPLTESRIRRCLGETAWESLAGKNILECGCGAGRFTELLLAQNAIVTSVDLSSAVEANAANFPVSPSHRIAQADIRHLPFAPGSFDIVFCLGVIQHTPHPEETIRCLYEKVAPGGLLVIDHYRHTWGQYTCTAPLFRAVLKHVPPRVSLNFTTAAVDLLLPVHKWAAKNRLLWSFVNRLSPVMCYYVDLPEMPDSLQREWALLDTHDSLTDWYKHFRTRAQIQEFLEHLGLEDLWCHEQGFVVEARGRKPAALTPMQTVS